MSTKLPHATVSLRPAPRPRLEPRQSLPGPIGGLVFDTGDVLYDATTWRRWLLKVLARLGLHTNYRSFYRVWDQDFLADVHRGQREFWEALESFLLSAGLSRGQIEEVQVAGRAQRRQWQATARLLPGVRRSLERLSQSGMPMAVVCDSELPRDAIEQLLGRVGLAETFGAVVCSRELGSAKPEAACYLAALEALQLAPQETPFVGHDRDELAAATRLGMPAIAFNYDPQAQADVYLDRFDELVDLVLSRRPLAAAG